MPADPSDLNAVIDALTTVNDGLERTWPRTTGSSLAGLLRLVADHDGIRPSAIAERLALHGSTVARHLREAEDAGFIRVAPDARDHRSWVVTLEAAGRQELRRLVDLRRGRLAPVLDGWERDELRALTRLLEKLEATMAAVAPPRPRSRRRGSARDAGHPDWLIEWFGR